MNTKKRIAMMALVSGLALVAVFSYRSLKKEPQSQPKVAKALPTVKTQTPKADAAPLPQAPEMALYPELKPTRVRGIYTDDKGALTYMSPRHKNEIRLWVYEHEKELPVKLSSYEIENTQTAYNTLWDKRVKLEESMAVADKSPSGKVEITIPSYANYGADLLTEFNAKLTQLMGPDKAVILSDALEKTVVNTNMGLGAGQQRIVIELADRASPPNMGVPAQYLRPGTYYTVDHNTWVYNKSGSEYVMPGASSGGLTNAALLAENDPVANKFRP